MKIIRFNEEMRIINKSEMDGWSVPDKKMDIKTGTKNLNLNLGQKVIELFAEYGIGIITVNRMNFLEKWKLVLPDEKNFVEHRVHIKRKQSWNDFIDEYEYDNNVKYDHLNEEEQEKIQNIYNELPYDVDDPYIEFSVFLPRNIDESTINQSAMSDASNYLKILVQSNIQSVLNGHSSYWYDILSDDTDGVKKFLIFKKIKINNNNIDDIITAGDRLHKDAKAIYQFEEVLGDNDSKDLFKEWIKLIE